MVTGEPDGKTIGRAAGGNAGLRPVSLKSLFADTLCWSNDVPVEIPQIVACLIGMAAPVAIGAMFNKLEMAMLASFGAMAVSGVRFGGPPAQIYPVLAGPAAVFAGCLIGGQGLLTNALMVVISAFAALLGGMSRTAARVSAVFIIFIIIGAGIGEGVLDRHPLGPALIFAGGTLWGIVASLVITALFLPAGHSSNSTPAVKYSNKQLLKRWVRLLGCFTGWRYMLRVALCMIAAEVVGLLLHQQHAYWILLTVAIVLQRNLASAFNRIWQRGIGTVAGVLLGGLLLWPLPQWGTVLMVGLLSALRPLFKNRNYAVYAMLMTPLMLLMLGQGQTVTGALLAERLLDTIIGCIIAITLGHLAWPDRNTLSRQV